MIIKDIKIQKIDDQYVYTPVGIDTNDVSWSSHLYNEDHQALLHFCDKYDVIVDGKAKELLNTTLVC